MRLCLSFTLWESLCRGQRGLRGGGKSWIFRVPAALLWVPPLTEWVVTSRKEDILEVRDLEEEAGKGGWPWQSLLLAQRPGSWQSPGQAAVECAEWSVKWSRKMVKVGSSSLGLCVKQLYSTPSKRTDELLEPMNSEGQRTSG